MVEFRRDWLTNIDSMQREMERLLDYFGSSKPPMVHFAPGVWEPAIDVYETEEDIVVLAELAGVLQEEIEVVVEGNTLVIRGERRDTLTTGKRTYYQIEIHKGPFERGIVLPAQVNPGQTRASYQDGLLEIVLPKAQKEQTLRVKIKTS